MKIELNNRSVLFVAGTLSKGGAERVISKLANHFSENGMAVYIACLLTCNPEYELNKNIKVIDLTEKKRTIFALFRWIKNLKKVIKRIKPDNIISFAGRVNIVTLLSAPRNSVIVSERNDPRYDGRGKLSTLLCKHLYRRKARHIVFQTNEVQSLFSNKIIKKSSIIRNPISKPDVFKQEYNDSSRIVMVGRLAVQKNYDSAIDAIAHIDNVFLDIYGIGPEKERLLSLIESKSLVNRVSFHDVVDDVNDVLLKSSIFLLSSHYEGLSNSLMEAMAVGLPCVSTPVAGSNEIIKHNTNGILTKGFDGNSIQDALMMLIESKELREKIGVAAVQTIKSFYEENVFNQWDRLLDIKN